MYELISRYLLSLFMGIILSVSALCAEEKDTGQQKTDKNEVKKEESEITSKSSLYYPENALWFIEMEKKFLAGIKGKQNNLTTGKYLLKLQFPEGKEKEYVLSLTIYDETKSIAIMRFASADMRGKRGGNIWQSNNAVYWVMKLPDINYYPSMVFLGLVDDKTIWGHIYRFNWNLDGWHDTAFKIGFFKVTPLTKEDEERLKKKTKKKSKEE